MCMLQFALQLDGNYSFAFLPWLLQIFVTYLSRPPATTQMWHTAVTIFFSDAKKINLMCISRIC